MSVPPEPIPVPAHPGAPHLETSPRAPHQQIPPLEIPFFERSDPSLSPAVAEPPVLPAADSLTRKVGTSVAWLMMQALGTKVASNAANLVLAWLLDKEDFGLIALATTATAFASLAQQAGQREILIQRQAHFARWANPAFWMALLMGCVGATAMLVAAPVAAVVFHEPRLIGLILILAVCAPIDALAVVPSAKLQAEMRFKTIGMVGLCTAVISMGLQVLFASPVFHAGAYAFVLPKPVISVITTLTFWRAAPARIKRNPQFRRWKYMVRDSGAMWGLAATGAVIMFGDNLTVGVVCGAVALGVYYFAYNLSLQALQLVMGNLQSALFPALSKLTHDPVRQVNAYLRAANVSGLIGCFGSLLQAVLAVPLFHLLFRTKWDAAIPVFQVLSVVMAISSLSGPTMGLFQAQGRFWTLLRYQLAVSVYFLACVVPGAFLGQALGVADGLVVMTALATPCSLWLALRPARLGLGTVLAHLAVPAVLAALAALPAALVSAGLHALGVRSLVVGLFLPGAAGVAACGVVLALWQPWVWSELRKRFSALRPASAASPRRRTLSSSGGEAPRPM